MKLKIIGTGSKGNAYLLESNSGEVLLIECGVPVDKIKEALDFNLNKLVGCIMTHEHKDHSRSATELMKLGVDVYSSYKTHKVMNNLGSHRAKSFPESVSILLGEFQVLSFDVKHDAVDPLGFLIHHKECGKVLFLTDTFFCGYTFTGLNNVIIEANYSKKIISQKYSDEMEFLKDRILQSHMSLETCCSTLKANDLSQCNNIVLIHLSDTNSNELEFASTVAELTQKNVMVASNGMEINFNKTPF